MYFMSASRLVFIVFTISYYSIFLILLRDFYIFDGCSFFVDFNKKWNAFNSVKWVLRWAIIKLIRIKTF